MSTNANPSSRGVIRSIRQLIVVVRFDEDKPQIGEILLAANPERSLLLVESLMITQMPSFETIE